MPEGSTLKDCKAKNKSPLAKTELMNCASDTNKKEQLAADLHDSTTKTGGSKNNNTQFTKEALLDLIF